MNRHINQPESKETIVELTGCPEILENDERCNQIAEIAERCVLESTDGPLEHVRVRCMNGHLLFMTVEALNRQTQSGTPA